VEFFDFLTFAVAVGCPTGLIIYVVNTTLGAKNKLRAQALQHALERVDQQERRISELTRQTEQLHEQLEWHVRLLASYERTLDEPAASNGVGRSLPGRR
jgi:16S rRNA C1402 (ribose-2'-O) methylase RsmI